VLGVGGAAAVPEEQELRALGEAATIRSATGRDPRAVLTQERPLGGDAVGEDLRIVCVEAGKAAAFKINWRNEVKAAVDRRGSGS
jgi:hypothetical protein